MRQEMRVGLRLRVVALTGGSSTKAMVSRRLNHALASLELRLSDDHEPSALTRKQGRCGPRHEGLAMDHALAMENGSPCCEDHVSVQP